MIEGHCTELFNDLSELARDSVSLLCHGPSMVFCQVQCWRTLSRFAAG